MNISPGPVPSAERFELFDVLRGIAMLGIFAVNLWSFSMPMAAYMNPSAYGSMEGLNGAAWWVVHVFFDTKFITLFSLLFGAGLVVMSRRADQAKRSSWARHLRRTFVLFLIGMAHAYLLWWGDILVAYAICGFLVFLLRRIKPLKQVVIGCLVFSVTPLLFLASYAGWASQLDGEAFQAELEEWAPGEEDVAAEIEIMQGSWREQMEIRVPEAAAMQTFVMLIFFLWRICGLMLIGMGLFQWGLLSGQWKVKHYQRMAAICLPVGLLLVITGAGLNVSTGWAWAESMFLYSQFNYFGSLLVTLGYVGVVATLVLRAKMTAWRARFAAVGRVALTCYLGQTLIATTLFFGHGFGWFGEVSRSGQFGIFLVVSTLQLLLAPIWLKHFNQGPLEWLLRGAVYGAFRPWRRSVGS